MSSRGSKFKRIVAICLILLMIVQFLPMINEENTFAAIINEQQYKIMMSFTYDGEGLPIASESVAKTVVYGNRVVFTLPDTVSENATEELKGLTPEVYCRDAVSPEQKQAVENLNRHLKDSRVFSVETAEWTEFLSDCEKLGWVNNRSTEQIPVINVEIKFTMHGAVPFNVIYAFQDPLDETKYVQDPSLNKSGIVYNTRMVSLRDIDEELPVSEQYVKKFNGFTLSKESEKKAAHTIVNADGTKPIILKYDRESYQINFATGNGKAVNPVTVKYGVGIMEALNKKNIIAERPGYIFNQWKGMAPRVNADGSPMLDSKGNRMYEYRELRATDLMPDNDILLQATWTPGQTKVYYQFWVDDVVNGEIYKPYSMNKATKWDYATTDQPIKTLYEDIALKAEQYFDVPDGRYFSYNREKTEQMNNGEELIKGDSSTVVNLYFNRKSFNLIFHLGWKEVIKYDVATEKYNNSVESWHKGYTWAFGLGNPTLTDPKVPEKKYHISSNNDDSTCYQITAKYEENILDKWPAEVVSPGSSRTFLYWGSQYGSGTNPIRGANEPLPDGATPYIAGSCGKMDEKLIMHDENGNPTGKPNHLVAIWSVKWEGVVTDTHTYHYLRECNRDVPGAKPASAFNVADYNGSRPSEDRYFEEVMRKNVTVASGANPEEPSNMALHKWMYTGRNVNDEKDVYYFYEKEKYQITFNYKLPTIDEETGMEKKIFTFSHLTTDPLGELAADENGNSLGYRIKDFDPADGQHVQGFDFQGFNIERWPSGKVKWYKDAEFKEPVSEQFNKLPYSDVTVYAKWKSDPVKATLHIQNGKYSEERLLALKNELMTQPGFEEAEINIEQTQDVSHPENHVVTITGLPKNAAMGPAFENFFNEGPENSGNSIFQNWRKTSDNTVFLYDANTEMFRDIDIVCTWAQDMSGEYTVEYVSADMPDGWNQGLGKVTVINPETNTEQEMYRLREPAKTTGVAVGSTVSERALSLKKYPEYITQARVKTLEISKDSTANTIVFYYRKIQSDLTYTVHYVLNQDNTNYKDMPLPADRDKPVDQGGVKIIKDKQVTRRFGESKTHIAEERAVAIPGYTIVKNTLKQLVLTENPDHNHIYFYYQKNNRKPEDTSNYPEYRVNVYLSEDGINYGTSPSYTGSYRNVKPGHVVNGRYLAEHPEVFVPQNEVEMFRSYVYDEAKNTQHDLHIFENPDFNKGENILNVFLKRAVCTITYRTDVSGNMEEPGWMHWNHNIEDIQQDPFKPSEWNMNISYGKSGTAPDKDPEHPAYIFEGWVRDGVKGDSPVKSADLVNQPWFTKINSSQLNLNAVWTKRNIDVYYTCYPKGGIWKDSDSKYLPVLDETNFEIGHYMVRSSDNMPQEPKVSPAFKEPEAGEVRRAFAGWSRNHPDVDGVLNPDGTIVESYKYNFNKEIPSSTHIERIYAVWNPQPYNIKVIKKDSDAESPVGDADFSLQRLLTNPYGTENSLGEPYKDESGNYVIDKAFLPVTMKTDATGEGAFNYLTEGFYLLSELAPEGYKGINPVVICIPQDPDNNGNKDVSGNKNGAYVYDLNGNADIVTEVEAGNHRHMTLIIGNKRVYRVEMELPKEIVYTYVPKEKIWDPVTMKYVDKSGSKESHWEMPETVFKVKNVSLDNMNMDVNARLTYNKALQDANLMYGLTTFYLNTGGTREDATLIRDSSGISSGLEIKKTLTPDYAEAEFHMKLNDSRHLPVPDVTGPMYVGKITVNFAQNPLILPPEKQK